MVTESNQAMSGEHVSETDPKELPPLEVTEYQPKRKKGMTFAQVFAIVLAAFGLVSLLYFLAMWLLVKIVSP